MDDGSRDIQDSIALLRYAVRDGIKEMVLTPHIYSGRWDNSLQTLKPRFDAFVRLVATKQIPIRLHLGAEVHLLVESLEMVERGEIPFLGQWQGEAAMLVELHDGRIPPYAAQGMRHLRRLGVRPVLAHPERNREVMADPSCVQALLAEGCLLQLTAGSLTGRFGPAAEKAAHFLVEKGWASFVASDAHNLRHRPPRMMSARRLLAQRFGPGIADELTQLAPRALLGSMSDEAAALALPRQIADRKPEVDKLPDIQGEAVPEA